jgi:hypothetical protein
MTTEHTLQRWVDDGHTVTAKYDDRRCNVLMVIGCPFSEVECGCHVQASAMEYGWEVFGGHGDFSLMGEAKPILWRYAAPEEIELKVRENA